MAKIGINENQVLAKVAKNDKGSIQTTWRNKREGAVADASDPLAAFGGGVSEGTGGGTTITIFPFDSKKGAYPDAPEVDGPEMTNRIAQVRDVLYHIAQQYMTTDKITLGPKVMFEGTGITGENYNTRILLEDVQAKVYDNLVTEFSKIMAPYLDKDELAMRLLLVRQSVKKAYADYRRRFLNDNPFLEPMAVTKEASALKYTKYEKDKGLNTDDDAAGGAVADTKAPEPETDPFAE